MNPSQLQSDTDNDANSLEGNDTIIESTNSPATSSSSDATSKPTPSQPIAGEPVHMPTDPNPPKRPRPPFFRNLWRRFNIYLLLFLLLLLIAGGVVAYLFYTYRTEKTDVETSIDSQVLSEDSLKELANSTTTIGNSKQVLNVESNAVFSGALLVRNNLEVAGTIKVGGDISLPGLTVSGNSSFSQISANTLSISGATTLQGPLNAGGGLNVTGNGNFSGNVTANQISANTLLINGDLSLTKHIVAGGPIPNLSRGNALGSGGTASISGSDSSGTVSINTGSNPGAGCFATVSFVRAYNNTPHVTVTPVGSGAGSLEYYVNRSTSNFSICTNSAAGGGQSFGFDYMVTG